MRHGIVFGRLQPFCMLIEHRVDDVDECLVARKKPVAAGEQISFEPTLAEMLAQDFHDATIDAEVGVDVFECAPSTPFRWPRKPPRDGSRRSHPDRIDGNSGWRDSASSRPAKILRECAWIRLRRCLALKRARRNRGNAVSRAAPTAPRHWRADSFPFGGDQSAQVPRTRRGTCRFRRTTHVACSFSSSLRAA